MPIRPENRARYPKDWPEISHTIRFERPTPVRHTADTITSDALDQLYARIDYLAGYAATLETYAAAQRQRAEQVEDLLRIAHATSNTSEAERARAVQRAERAERVAQSAARDTPKALADYLAAEQRAEKAEAANEQAELDAEQQERHFRTLSNERESYRQGWKYEQGRRARAEAAIARVTSPAGIRAAAMAIGDAALTHLGRDLGTIHIETIAEAALRAALTQE